MINSFVAIGDSFTEGLNDFRSDGTVAGWADRLACYLDADQPGLRYANLAVRGRLLDQIVEEQFASALAEHPDVLAFSAGGNDLLRVGSDPDAVAARYETAVAQLRASGAQVLVFTGFDVGSTPVLRLARGRIAIYNEHLRVIAARHDCLLVDLWSLDALRDRRAFSDDRLHLSPEGHERVARLAGRVLGLETAAPDEPWPGTIEAATRRDDLIWARTHLVPWVRRRIRGESSGDAVVAKRPVLDAVHDARTG
ncbi:MAG: hydrolase [Jatrophihabitans sp.]|nr:hydrolase [Jatrophihabitans sp.]